MALDWAAEAARAAITASTALLASFVGAKWAESRKLQARFEKLDEIRAEMREVTRAQEDIKRQLQGGEWNRQTLWKQRLDAYTQLLRVSTDYLDRCYLVRASLSGVDHGADREDLRQLRADTFKAMTVVEIFGDADILSALRRFFEITRESNAPASDGTTLASLSREIEALCQLQTSFVSAARQQLQGAINP